MKANLFLIIVISVVCIIYSCSNSKPDGADFKEESFRKTFLLAEGRMYKNDSLFIGHPTSIRFHPDSFLIVQCMSTQKLVKIVDLKSNIIQEVIPQGKGPGEIIVPWGIEIIGKDLYVFCGQLRKVIKLTPDINRKFKIAEEFSLDEKQTTRFYPLKTDLMVCLSKNGDAKRLTFLDNKGKIIKKLGDYPPLLNSKEIKGDNNIFQSAISATPDGNKIVLACTLTDVLEIYDIDKGLEKRFQGPLGIHLTITKQTVGSGKMLHHEPAYMTYRNISANANEFWVDYNGYKLEKGKRPLVSETSPKQIFCFDWEGNPLRKIEFNFPFMAFDVDWNGKVLYSLAWQAENPEIIAYPLNGILK